MNLVGEFHDLLLSSTNTVVFTGAGVSTASGIRDFRGKNGIYNDTFRGYNVEELFGIDLFNSDPSLFYAWAKDFVYDLEAFQPCTVHHLLPESRGEHKELVERLKGLDYNVVHGYEHE